MALPLVSRLRWSFRWLPLFHLCLILISAEILKTSNKRDLTTQAGMGLLAIGISFGYAWQQGSLSDFPLALAFLGLSAVWWIASSLKRLSDRSRIGIAIGLSVFSLLLKTTSAPPSPTL